MARTKIPFKTEMQIVKRRLESTIDATAEEFGISRGAVIAVMKRNADIVEDAKRKMREDASDYIAGRSEGGSDG